MKHFVNVLISFCLLWTGTTIQAQNSIPASGSNAAGSGGSVSYTLGQVVYTNISGTSGYISQGIQLPYEISVLTPVNEVSGITSAISVYPNPANGFVTLKVESNDAKSLNYMLLT